MVSDEDTGIQEIYSDYPPHASTSNLYTDLAVGGGGGGVEGEWGGGGVRG